MCTVAKVEEVFRISCGGRIFFLTDFFLTGAQAWDEKIALIEQQAEQDALLTRGYDGRLQVLEKSVRDQVSSSYISRFFLMWDG